MSEPEHLRADGARLGRGRSWVIIAVVLLVVVGLAVLRLGRSGSDTTPRPVPTAPATSPAGSEAWPTDLPAGTLFVGSEGWVHTVDTRDGAVVQTSAEADSHETSLTPVAGGVVVWSSTSHARSFTRTDGTSRPVPDELRAATAFLPAADGSVWAAEPVPARASRTTWRRVDVDGRASTSVSVEGSAASDGAGGLLSVTDDGFRSAYPASRRPRQTGDVVATGPAGYLRRTCGEADCRFTLHRHQDEPDTVLTTAVGEDTTGGTLSPTNRLLAVAETVGGTSTLRVSVVGTGQIDEIFDEPRGSTDDAVWLDDRWLALISEDQLVLYDATDDRVVRPTVPLRSLGPLAWVPA